MICTKGWQVSYGITEHVEHVLKTIPNLGNCRVLHCKIKKLSGDIIILFTTYALEMEYIS